LHKNLPNINAVTLLIAAVVSYILWLAVVIESLACIAPEHAEVF
jgi:hypothetical protein